MSIRLADIPKRPVGDPDKYDAKTIRDELIVLSNDDFGPLCFVNNYCKIYSNDVGGWIPFELWDTHERCAPYDSQLDFLVKLRDNKRVLCLKSRQNGISWICLAFGLWLLLFRPQQAMLLLSRGEIEALSLMKRLRGIYSRLPKWLKAKSEDSITKNYWELSNGSTAISLSTNKGDSYSFTYAVLDEVDLIQQGGQTNLAELLMRVEPAVGMNGRLVLVSKPDKSRPNSTFKNMFRSAMKGELPDYAWSFVPWRANPNRTEEWYSARVKESIAKDGSLDSVRENYSESIDSALSPRSVDKRLPFDWVKQCYIEEPPLTRDQIKELYDPRLFERHSAVFTIPGIEIYRLPKSNEEYILGVDTSEGLQAGDFGSIHVLRRSNKEECLLVKTKCEPSTLAYYAHIIGNMYNRAKVLPERNQHGHAFILWMREFSDLAILSGIDPNNANSLSVQKRAGWPTTSVTKSLGYSKVADALRDQDCIIHSAETFRQLCSITESKLEAPRGEYDDCATTFMLGISAITLILNKTFSLEFI